MADTRAGPAAKAREAGVGRRITDPRLREVHTRPSPQGRGPKRDGSNAESLSGLAESLGLCRGCSCVHPPTLKPSGLRSALIEHHSRRCSSRFAAGFLGATAALMVAAAVWFAVVQPLNRPGLVWGGAVYRSKQEFNLYLKSKGLSYATWLRRNPGVAPWEPGEAAAKTDQDSEVWDWKRDALLAVNAALLAMIAAALLARVGTPESRPANEELPAPEVAAPSSPVPTISRRVARGLGYVELGADELAHAAMDRIGERPEHRHELEGIGARSWSRSRHRAPSNTLTELTRLFDTVQPTLGMYAPSAQGARKWWERGASTEP